MTEGWNTDRDPHGYPSGGRYLPIKPSVDGRTS
jgi:hypothetical protein